MPDLKIEQKIKGLVCGIDEVGRGPLVGPVVAACVYIPPEKQHLVFWNEVTDSKKLSQKKRSYLDKQIKENCKIGISQATTEEIDNINILQASLLAMQRAYEQMNIRCDTALIDGNKAPNLACTTQTIVKGDTISLSIAAASIIAKVYRDKLLISMSETYPHYGWERNSGYGTKEHLQALEKHGVTEHHRKTFAPIKRILSA